MQMEIEPRHRYFLVRVTGIASGGSLEGYVARVLSFGKRSGLRRVLLDERELTLGTDMYEAYQIGESEAVVTAAMGGYRFACLASPENRDRNKAFETVMRNRSVNYRVFDSLEEAETWLLA